MTMKLKNDTEKSIWAKAFMLICPPGEYDLDTHTTRRAEEAADKLIERIRERSAPDTPEEQTQTLDTLLITGNVREAMKRHSWAGAPDPRIFYAAPFTDHFHGYRFHGYNTTDDVERTPEFEEWVQRCVLPRLVPTSREAIREGADMRSNERERWPGSEDRVPDVVSDETITLPRFEKDPFEVRKRDRVRDFVEAMGKEERETKEHGFTFEAQVAIARILRANGWRYHGSGEWAKTRAPGAKTKSLREAVRDQMLRWGFEWDDFPESFIQEGELRTARKTKPGDSSPALRREHDPAEAHETWAEGADLMDERGKKLLRDIESVNLVNVEEPPIRGISPPPRFWAMVSKDYYPESGLGDLIAVCFSMEKAVGAVEAKLREYEGESVSAVIYEVSQSEPIRGWKWDQSRKAWAYLGEDCYGR